MTLDELERLHQAATPGPWAEFAESGDWWVAQADADGGSTPSASVCASGNDVWTRQTDIDLTIAARNALPALLRVARAAQEYQSAYEMWRVARYSLNYAAETRRREQFERAQAELRAALAELESNQL